MSSMISFKSSDFIPPRGALAIPQGANSCAQATNSCKQLNAGRMRAPPRAQDQSDRFLDLLRALTSSSTSSASSRSPASSTDGHHHDVPQGADEVIAMMLTRSMRKSARAEDQEICQTDHARARRCAHAARVEFVARDLCPGRMTGVSRVHRAVK